MAPPNRIDEPVKAFAWANGLAVAATHPNRLVLDIVGPAAAVERALHLTFRTYRHPTEARDFYAPDTEPAVDAALPMADIQGLSDYFKPHPRLRKQRVLATTGRTGSAPDGSGGYFGMISAMPMPRG